MENFLPLELGTLYVVLGMQCLQVMGKMEVDWPVLTMSTMSLIRGEKGIVLRGAITNQIGGITQSSLLHLRG